MMRKYLIGVILLLILSLIGYSTYRLRHATDKQRLAGIEVQIHAPEGVPVFMDSDDVLREMALLGLNYKGVPIDSIDVGHVENKLRRNPLFKDVEVFITASTGKMKVEVTQQQALFLVQTPKKSFYVTQERGIVPLNPRYAVYLPLATGDISEEFACTKLYDLMETIKSDNYFRNYFGQIYVTPDEEIILCPRVGKTPLLLGHSTDWADMLHKYKVFAQEVITHVGDDAYEYIKLPYKNQIVARPHGWEHERDSLTKQ